MYTYIPKIWEVLPVYQFYDVELPDSDKQVYVYNTYNLVDVTLNPIHKSKYFALHGVYHASIHRYVGVVIEPIQNVTYRYSAHSVSACTDESTLDTINTSSLVLRYETDYLQLYAFGNDAEIVTDLPRVMQVHIDERK